MELRQLHYFVAVADTLSFTKASEILYVTQPALSNQISNLEDELGAKLLTRTKRSVILTPTGVHFLHDARELLRRAECLSQSVKTDIWSPMEQYHLHIGFEPVSMDARRVFSAVVQAIRNLRKDYHATDVFFRNIEHEPYRESLSSGINDVVLSLCPIASAPTDLNCRLLETSTLLLVTADPKPLPDNSETVRKILTTRDLFLDADNVVGLTDALQVISNLNVTPRIRFNESRIIMSLMVASGVGSVIVPSGATTDFDGIPDIQMLELNRDYPLGLYAIWSKENSNPLLPVFLNSLTANLGDRQQN